LKELPKVTQSFFKEKDKGHFIVTTSFTPDPTGTLETKKTLLRNFRSYHFGYHDRGHGSTCLIKTYTSRNHFANCRLYPLAILIFPKLKGIRNRTVPNLGNN
jgi:hypothetical protein